MPTPMITMVNPRTGETQDVDGSYSQVAKDARHALYNRGFKRLSDASPESDPLFYHQAHHGGELFVRRTNGKILTVPIPCSSHCIMESGKPTRRYVQDLRGLGYVRLETAECEGGVSFAPPTTLRQKYVYGGMLRMILEELADAGQLDGKSTVEINQAVLHAMQNAVQASGDCITHTIDKLHMQGVRKKPPTIKCIHDKAPVHMDTINYLKRLGYEERYRHTDPDGWQGRWWRTRRN